jgi:transposase
MPRAVTVTRAEYTAADLRREAGRARDGNAARRMLAIALVLEGGSRDDAARTCGMDRQTLRDWVHRFNGQGLVGLSNDTTKGGRRPRLTPEQKAELAAIVRKGPDVKVDGVVRWRRIDLQEVIRKRFAVELAERTIGTILHNLGFRRLSPRPSHPKKDDEAQETFKKTSPSLSPRHCRKLPKASPLKSGGRTKPESDSKEL